MNRHSRFYHHYYSYDIIIIIFIAYVLFPIFLFYLSYLLYQLLKDNVQFNFGEDQINVYEFIKLKLSEDPLLCLYNPDSETNLHRDSFFQSFKFVLLLQKQEGEKFPPIFFYNHRTPDAESCTIALS